MGAGHAPASSPARESRYHCPRVSGTGAIHAPGDGSPNCPRRRSSGAEQAAHNRRVGGSSPPAATPVTRSFRSSTFSEAASTRSVHRPKNKGMTLRYCPHCAAEVATTDGFCRLGHSVKLLAPVASLDAFSAELGSNDGTTPTAGAGPPPPPERLGMAPLGRFGALWEAGDLDRPGTDPIASFAPYPRMDWGPRRPWRRSLSRRRQD